MIKKNDRLIVFLLDFLASEVAFYLFFVFKFKSRLLFTIFSPSFESYIVPSILMSLFFVGIYAIMGLYDRPNWITSTLDELFALSKGTIIGIFIIVFFVSGLRSIYTPSQLLLYFLFQMGMVFLLRLIFRRVVIEAHRCGKHLIPAIIIGERNKSQKVKQELSSFPELGYNIIGVFDYQGCDACDGLQDMSKFVRANRVEEVILALSTRDHEDIIRIMDTLSDTDVSFKVVPEMYDLIAGQKGISIFGAPLVELFQEPLNPAQKILKRAMDIVGSIAAIIVFAPLFLIIPLVIKLDSPGPIFYKQFRVGKKGKEFWLYKFRTMVKDAEKITGPVWAKKDDPRITKVGKFLRRTRLDELPQFLNVLRGDMSLVGPRPERPFFVSELKKKIPLYSKRFLVKPGITGWAQVKHKYDSSLDDVAEKLKYDFYYIENMSIFLDIKIIIRTIIVMLSGKGAH